MFHLVGQDKHDKARPLLERALRIQERGLAADHPSTTASCTRLASLYSEQGPVEKALSLSTEVVASLERTRGRGHPEVASALANQAGLLASQVGTFGGL